MKQSIWCLPSLGFELILEKYWNQVIALLIPILESILSSIMMKTIHNQGQLGASHAQGPFCQGNMREKGRWW
jgi:hypothetical protein